MINLEFKKPTLEDASWVKPILKNSCGLGAENAFGSIFVWGDAYNLKICRYKNFLLRTFSENGKEYFLYPTGTGNVRECIEIMADYAKNRKTNIFLSSLTQKNVEQLEELFPNKFEYEEERNKEDYIYNSVDLIELKGRKYHSKRNHIAKFNRMYKWSFEEISEKNIEQCKKFCDKWFDDNIEEKRADIILEKNAIDKAFKYYNELSFLGGLIKVDGNIVALTFGEKINDYVFDVHFEKALKIYNSAYAVINNEFAKRYLNAFSYINREEDMGIPGLRKVKLSYNPVALLKRYKASFK